MELAELGRVRMRAQRLWGTRADDPQDAVRSLLAIQAQEFAYAMWSVAQRTKRASSSALAAAVDEGRILRTHVLRPTWHFVAPQDLRWLIRLSGPRVNAANARRYEELGLDGRTLARAADIIAGAVAAGHLTRRELAAILQRKRIATDGQRIAHIVMRAELDAVICSGARKGTQHGYAAFDERVPATPGPEGDEALAELATRYFTARGPATLKDLAWWSGLSMKDARRAIEAMDPQPEQLVVDGRTYHSAGRIARRSPSSGPKVDLVQCYDESIISYSESRDVLMTPAVSFAVPRIHEGFSHVILCDGKLLGRWRLVRARHGVTIETRLERRPGAAERAALDRAVERCRRFFG